MSGGEVLTIHLTTDELKKLIRDEITTVVADRPTQEDVKGLVKAEVNAALSPITQALEKIRTDLENSFDRRFNQADKQLAVLVEQVQAMNAAVRDVKDEQKRIDDEQDELKRDLGEIKSLQIEQSGKLDSQERAIFGDPNRPGTKSIIDHISDNFEQWGNRIGQQFEKMNADVQSVLAKTQETDDKLAVIEKAVEENAAFRKRRQKIEQAVIQLVPNAVKKTLGDVAWDWVKSKAIPATIGATLFSLLIEWLKATS